MMSMFRGVGVALITPFKEDLSIDYDALERIINNGIEGGVDYFLANGTTSEASTLTLTEKDELLIFITKTINGRTPIMYGIGNNNTSQVIDLINKTDFTSISSILTVSPYYNRPSQQGIIQHYSKIADASPTPVFLYNVPGRTGSNMTAETTTTLSKHQNIAGIKEASGDLNQCFEIMRDKSPNFMLLSGDDLLATPMISIGCEGAISVIANAYPKEFSQMIHDAMKGDYKSAQNTLFEFTKINDFLYEESNPVGIKQVLSNLGVCENYVREPLLKASSNLETAIKTGMEQMAF